jgi:hypothetical protein
MGIQDRDYMRERNRWRDSRPPVRRDRPFEPPNQSPPTLVIVFTWICIAFVLYKGYGWLQQKREDHRNARVAAANAQAAAQRELNSHYLRESERRGLSRDERASAVTSRSERRRMTAPTQIKKRQPGSALRALAERSTCARRTTAAPSGHRRTATSTRR